MNISYHIILFDIYAFTAYTTFYTQYNNRQFTTGKNTYKYKVQSFHNFPTRQQTSVLKQFSFFVESPSSKQIKKIVVTIRRENERVLMFYFVSGVLIIFNKKFKLFFHIFPPTILNKLKQFQVSTFFSCSKYAFYVIFF